MPNELDTLTDFEAWWKMPKKLGWLQFPQAQKMAAKSAWDAAIKFIGKKYTQDILKLCDNHKREMGDWISPAGEQFIESLRTLVKNS